MTAFSVRPRPIDFDFFEHNRMTDPTLITRTRIHHTWLELVEGDITLQTTGAIVNAANNSLLGGGGVDGAIHRAAGPKLLAETRTLGGCETGDAKISGGYNLKARYVIHTVGPIYRPHDPTVATLLARAHRRSLELAVAHQVRSVAFPAISTGIYGYPPDEAAPIALAAVIDFCRHHSDLELVRFVLFSDSNLEIFARHLTRLVQQPPDQGTILS